MLIKGDNKAHHLDLVESWNLDKKRLSRGWNHMASIAQLYWKI